MSYREIAEKQEWFNIVAGCVKSAIDSHPQHNPSDLTSSIAKRITGQVLAALAAARAEERAECVRLLRSFMGSMTGEEWFLRAAAWLEEQKPCS